MKEVYKNIEGYDGKYQVSNLGNVRNTKTGRVLKPHANEKGYLYICLYQGKESKSHRVHRLVAKHFIGNPKNYDEVNHLDEDKQNNSVSNLMWCSHKFNINYGTGIKRRVESIKDKDYNFGKPKKKINQYSLEGELLKVWDSGLQIQNELGYPQSNIVNVCNGKGNHKTCKGYIWSYV